MSFHIFIIISLSLTLIIIFFRLKINDSALRLILSHLMGGDEILNDFWAYKYNKWHAILQVKLFVDTELT